MDVTYTTLVETHELDRLLDRDGVVIIDCRHSLADPSRGAQQYRDGHIPGAWFLHLDRDLSGPTTGSNGRHPLPDPRRLAARLGEIGVGPGVQVVAYDEANCMVSVRVWWLLNWLGHPDVAVLNGGFSRWLSEARPVTTDLPATPAARRFAVSLSMPTVDADYVLGHLHRPDITIVDARGADRYRGENETIDPVAGHIPGSFNRPFADNLAADGRFKPIAQLRDEFTRLLRGRDPATVVHSCGSGVSACHNILAMKMIGMDAALTLYPGSWSHWCGDPTRPTATGDDDHAGPSQLES